MKLEGKEFKIGDRVRIKNEFSVRLGIKGKIGIVEYQNESWIGVRLEEIVEGSAYWSCRSNILELIESFDNETQKEFNAYQMEQLINKQSRCECGSEAVGSSGHSAWCPKHGV